MSLRDRAATALHGGQIRAAARGARLAAERARLQVWARRVDARLRRAGGRLVLDAPRGAHFHELPHVEVHPRGGDAGVLTLRLHEHAHLGRDLVLEVWAGADNLVELGEGTAFRAGTRLQLRGGVIALGDFTVFRDHCVLDVMGRGEIRIGERAQFGSRVALHAVERIELGDLVAIGESTSVFDSDHSHDGSDVPVYDQPLAVTPIVVERNTFVGAGSMILRGVRLGPNALVASASVVRGGDYPGGHLYAGNPLRQIRPLGAPRPR